jgi:hypothetical protein
MLDKWRSDIQASALLLTLHANNSSSLWELTSIELHPLMVTDNFWASGLIRGKFWLNTLNSTYNEIVEHKDMFQKLGYAYDLVHDFSSTHPLKNHVWCRMS